MVSVRRLDRKDRATWRTTPMYSSTCGSSTATVGQPFAVKIGSSGESRASGRRGPYTTAQTLSSAYRSSLLLSVGGESRPGSGPRPGERDAEDSCLVHGRAPDGTARGR